MRPSTTGFRPSAYPISRSAPGRKYPGRASPHADRRCGDAGGHALPPSALPMDRDAAASRDASDEWPRPVTRPYRFFGNRLAPRAPINGTHLALGRSGPGTKTPLTGGGVGPRLLGRRHDAHERRGGGRMARSVPRRGGQPNVPGIAEIRRDRGARHVRALAATDAWRPPESPTTAGRGAGRARRVIRRRKIRGPKGEPYENRILPGCCG